MEPNAYCQSYVFLSYSVIFWVEHSRDQKNSNGIKTLIRWVGPGLVGLLVLHCRVVGFRSLEVVYRVVGRGWEKCYLG